MRLKRYLVRDMREALRLIKAELGPEAMIVQTQAQKPKGLRRLWCKGQLEVLAAVEDDRAVRAQATAIAAKPTKEDSTRLRLIEERLDAITRSLESISACHQVSTSPGLSPSLAMLQSQGLASEILARLQSLGVEGGTGALTSHLRRMLPPCTQLTLHGQKPDVIFLIGPTGVGKTTTLAKMAAELSLRHGRRVALATVDTYRVAAVNQLEIYANLLNAPLRVVYEPSELRQVVEDYAGYDVVLVDTPGRSPSDERGLSELEEYLGAVPRARALLLIEAEAHLANMRKIASAFQAARREGLIFTKLDETEVAGPLFSIAVEVGRPVFYLTTGQNVPQDIEPATAERLLSLLMANASSGSKQAEDGFTRVDLRALARSAAGG